MRTNKARRHLYVGTSVDMSVKGMTAPKCCGCENMPQHLLRHYQMPT